MGPMMELRRALTVLLGLLSLGGGGACGEDEGRAETRDAPAVDVVFSDVGTTPPRDAGPTGTSDTADTAVAADTTVADTTAADTTVADTTVADTTVADSTVPDTTVQDTTVGDTSVGDMTVEDTTVADTSAPDTTVADTTIADTTATDTADTDEPACQSGGCETDMTPSGATCTDAWIIGRPNAQSGFGHAGSTVGAGNDSDFPQAACGDSGPDRFYRIYLKVGEQLWVNANPSPATFDVTFGLYRGAACETPITCVDNDVDQATPDTMPYQAVVEGWHTLVVDGRGSQGDYTVVVTLDCQEEDCCCR